MASIIHYLLHTVVVQHKNTLRRLNVGGGGGGADDNLTNSISKTGRNGCSAADLCPRTSSLLQTAAQVSLHVDVSLCRWWCSLSDVGGAVPAVCALGPNPIRPTSLNISGGETWSGRIETRGKQGVETGVRRGNRAEKHFPSVFNFSSVQFCIQTAN